MPALGTLRYINCRLDAKFVSTSGCGVAWLQRGDSVMTREKRPSVPAVHCPPPTWTYATQAISARPLASSRNCGQ